MPLVLKNMLYVTFKNTVFHHVNTTCFHELARTQVSNIEACCPSCLHVCVHNIVMFLLLLFDCRRVFYPVITMCALCDFCSNICTTLWTVLHQKPSVHLTPQWKLRPWMNSRGKILHPVKISPLQRSYQCGLLVCVKKFVGQILSRAFYGLTLYAWLTVYIETLYSLLTI